MCVTKDLLFVSLNYHCVTKQDFALNLCLAIIGIFIVLINLLAVVTLVKHTDLEEPTNYFIANLAAADALIGFFVLYDFFYNILQFKFYIECVLRVGLFISVNIASVLNLTALTYDRYLKITKPYLYIRAFTMKKVRFAEGFIWSMSIVCGLLPFFGWSSMKILEICNFFGIMSWSYLLFVIVIFTVPSVVMVAVYAIFVVVAARHRSKIAKQSSSMASCSEQFKSWRTLKTACVIVGAYFLCWGPAGVFILMVVMTDVEENMSTSPNVIFNYLLGIGVFNSILNPIIYASKIPVFRKKLFQMLCVSQLQELKRVSLRSFSSVFRSSLVSTGDLESNVSHGSGNSAKSTSSKTSHVSSDHKVQVEVAPFTETRGSETAL